MFDKDFREDYLESSKRRKLPRRKPCGCSSPRGYLRGRLPHNIRFAHQFCTNCSGLLSDQQRQNLISQRLATYAIERETNRAANKKRRAD